MSEKDFAKEITSVLQSYLDNTVEIIPTDDNGYFATSELTKEQGAFIEIREGEGINATDCVHLLPHTCDQITENLVEKLGFKSKNELITKISQKRIELGHVQQEQGEIINKSRKFGINTTPKKTEKLFITSLEAQLKENSDNLVAYKIINKENIAWLPLYIMQFAYGNDQKANKPNLMDATLQVLRGYKDAETDSTQIKNAITNRRGKEIASASWKVTGKIELPTWITEKLRVKEDKITQKTFEEVLDFFYQDSTKQLTREITELSVLSKRNGDASEIKCYAKINDFKVNFYQHWASYHPAGSKKDEIEIGKIGKKISSLDEEIKKTRTNIQKEKDEHENKEIEHMVLKESYGNSRQQLSDDNEDFNRKTSKLKKNSDKYKTLADELAVTKKTKEDLGSQLTELESNLTKKEEEISKYSKKLEKDQIEYNIQKDKLDYEEDRNMTADQEKFIDTMLVCIHESAWVNLKNDDTFMRKYKILLLRETVLEPNRLTLMPTPGSDYNQRKSIVCYFD